ncbi:Proline dehydrogenase 1, mitochondrial [Coccomyxa sp. Obi]|nr:Proline dehydrogenase 1, mitochondrial [Coccomyxa sp. Obi]
MNAVARLVALRQHAASSQAIFRTSYQQLQPTALSSFFAEIPPATQPPLAHPYVASAQPQPLEEEEASPQPAPRAASRPDKEPFVPLNFNDPQIAFRSKTTGDLLLAYGVFSACQVKPVVNNADALLKLSKRLLGSTIVNGIVKRTFFRHFCAGESQEDIKPRMAALYDAGIGGILDYAAEDDVDAADGPASRCEPHDTVVARTYDYDTEAACDRHTSIFLRSIDAAAQGQGQGFAAIKLTALGNPKLLERVSAGLVAIRNLFGQFDLNHDNVVSHEEFEEVYAELFNDASPERMDQLFRYLDKDNTGVVDFLSWSRRIRLQDIPQVIKQCKAPGPLSFTALSEEELRLLNNLMGRLYQLAEAAAAAGVRLMVDAEHSYFQPAIDHAAMELQRTFNRHTPTIFNTYQCYLKDSHERILLDMQRARQEGFLFGAKLVRGAYLHLERGRAKEKGYPSPIHDSIEATHANYNRIVEEALSAVAEDGAEFMIASHNQASVERAVALMHERGLDHRTVGVFFGQLLGMADPLSFVLGANGYRAYKYVPFGPVEEVMPYLVRRAQENSTVLGGVQKEKAMVAAELRRRILRLGRA